VSSPPLGEAKKFISLAKLGSLSPLDEPRELIFLLVSLRETRNLKVSFWRGYTSDFWSSSQAELWVWWS